MSESPKTIQRDRSKLDLTITNIEIQTANYHFCKAVARAKRMPMSVYIDKLIERRRMKHELYTKQK